MKGYYWIPGKRRDGTDLKKEAKKHLRCAAGPPDDRTKDDGGGKATTFYHVQTQSHATVLNIFQRFGWDLKRQIPVSFLFLNVQ